MNYQNDILSALKKACEYAEHQDFQRALQYVGNALNHVYLYGNAGDGYITAACLKVMGQVYFRAGNIGAAEDSYRKSLKQEEECGMHNTIDYAATLHCIAEICSLTGRFQEAENCYIRVQNMLQQIGFLTAGDFYRKVQLNRAINLSGMGALSEAENMLLQITSLKEEDGGTADIHARAISELAHVYAMTGRLDKAGRLYLEANNSLGREESGSADPDITVNLSAYYLLTGNVAEAENLLREIEKDIDRLHGKESWKYAQIFTIKGIVLTLHGRYQEALKILKQAEATLQVNGSGHLSTYAFTICALAILHIRLGDLTSAEKLIDDILESGSEGETGNLALKPQLFLIKISILVIRRSFDKAVVYLTKLSNILARGGGTRKMELFVAQLIMAEIFEQEGRIKEAEILCASIEQGLESESKPIPRLLAAVENRLGYLNLAAGNADTAQKRFDKSLSIIRSIYHKEHPESIMALLGSATAKALQGDCLSSISQALEAARSSLPLLGETVCLGSDEEYIRYLSAIKCIRDTIIFISVAFCNNKAARLKEAFDYVLKSKGLSFDAEQIRIHAKESPVGDSLEARIRMASCERILEVLPENAILLEYVVYECRQYRSSEGWYDKEKRICVWKLSKDERIELYDLGSFDHIRDIVHEYRNLLGNPISNTQELLIAGSSLYEEVLPWSDMLTSPTDRIIIAPDGPLCLLPFEALVTNEGFLGDGPTISYLTSGRDLLKDNVGSDDLSLPVIIGKAEFENEGSLPYSSLECTAISKQFICRTFTGNAAAKEEILGLCSPSILHIATHGFFQKAIDTDVLQDMPSLFKLASIPDPMYRSGLLLGEPIRNRITASDTVGWMDGILAAREIVSMKLKGTELAVLSACNTGEGDIFDGEGVFGLRRAFVLAGVQTIVMSMWQVDDLAAVLLMVRFYENLMQRGLCRISALQDAKAYVRYITAEETRTRLTELENHTGFSDCSFVRLKAELSLMDAESRPFAHPYYWSSLILQGMPNHLTEKKF